MVNCADLTRSQVFGLSNLAGLNFGSEYSGLAYLLSNKTAPSSNCITQTPLSNEVVTAPSVYAPHHLKNFQIFKDRANKAFEGAFPKKWRPRYSSVKVLLLRWEEDDLGVTSELSSLKKVFERVFRFETESWNIPSVDSEDALTSRILSFRKHAAEDTLLVVYYGGHADRELHNHCTWRW